MSAAGLSALLRSSNTVFLGEAGCGKSELAVHWALALVSQGREVHFFDLDQTKPLMRSRDAAALLTDAGVTVLRNASVRIRNGVESIRLIGVDDPSFGGEANLDATLEALSSDDFTVLLAHRPEGIDEYAKWGIDLVLSGHAHGGQIRIPGIGGVYAPGQGFFPKYTSGEYAVGDTTMIVSRGLGNSVLPLRVNDRPEIVIVTLNK